MPQKAARHPPKCDEIDDVKLFLTVYLRIYCRKFLTLSNKTSRYKIKCIIIVNVLLIVILFFLFIILYICLGVLKKYLIEIVLFSNHNIC